MVQARRLETRSSGVTSRRRSGWSSLAQPRRHPGQVPHDRAHLFRGVTDGMAPLLQPIAGVRVAVRHRAGRLRASRVTRSLVHRTTSRATGRGEVGRCLARDRTGEFKRHANANPCWPLHVPGAARREKHDITPGFRSAAVLGCRRKTICVSPSRCCAPLRSWVLPRSQAIPGWNHPRYRRVQRSTQGTTPPAIPPMTTPRMAVLPSLAQ